jgi:hypothetical protein
MPRDSRMIGHALEVLRQAADDGMGRPLTAGEKLACRVLLPIVGKDLLVRFSLHIEGGNPMYRKALIEQAVGVIERAARG